MKILEKLYNDLKQGENLELYPLIILSLALAIFNFLGMVTEPQIFSVILGAMSFLAISALVSRYKLSDLVSNLAVVQKGNQEQLNHLIELQECLGKPAEIHFEPAEIATGKFYKSIIKYISEISAGDEILIISQAHGSGEPSESAEYKRSREAYSKALIQKAKEPME